MDYLAGIRQVMNYSVARRENISNNIVNANTPGFKAKRLAWYEALEQGNWLYKTNEKHLHAGGTQKAFIAKVDNTVEVKTDGNSVDMNKEITEMLKNNQVYSIAVQALNNRSVMKSAARGS